MGRNKSLLGSLVCDQLIKPHLIIILSALIVRPQSTLMFIDFARTQSVRLYLCHSLDSIVSFHTDSNKINIRYLGQST